MDLSTEILYLADLILADVELFEGYARLKSGYLFDLVAVEVELLQHEAVAQVLDVGDAILSEVQAA